MLQATQLNPTAIAAIDTQLSEERTAEKQEAYRLRCCIATGTYEVRLHANRVVCSTGTTTAAGASMPSPAGLTMQALALDGETGLAVLDLRSSVRDDAAKLQYLQAYARQCAGIEAQNQQVDMHPR
ncbi:lysis system i-spanin subunit Rz [Comamonas odontotermitis]|uniref:lysis system i-spanin subunit Rz n=1 Tax=Comamonas odontotermitis TaxID=379895 RepID=UPI00160AC480